jgi:beta-glucosidase
LSRENGSLSQKRDIKPKILSSKMLWQCIFYISLINISLTVSDYPFRNVSLSWSDRVDDLVDRLTLDQIVQQLARGGAGEHGGPAPAIENLGIGPYQWNTECLRGDVEAGNATSFPQAIGLAAAFRYIFTFDR